MAGCGEEPHADQRVAPSDVPKAGETYIIFPTAPPSMAPMNREGAKIPPSHRSRGSKSHDLPSASSETFDPGSPSNVSCSRAMAPGSQGQQADKQRRRKQTRPRSQAS